jgi:DNA topoisomerase-1
MKKLLIVESPSKIKTISKFLGKEFNIVSTLGHIKDLPKKKLGIHINDDIELDYAVLPDKEKTIKDIIKHAKQADEIFLAPDPDREGEIIAYHVSQEIAKVIKDSQKVHRISFNEITQPAIEKALQTAGDINADKVAAQQARRVLDRWVGYQVSPILWRKLAKGLSAGRVQSVALKFICERETAIREFKPEEYWSVDGLFGHKKESFNTSLTHINKKKISLSTKKATQKVVDDAYQQSYSVDSIKDSKRLKNPHAPFMTSTLQQSAYNQLGFSVQRTMQIAQKLYEGLALQDGTPVALITYMRTDSLRLSDVATKQVRDFIKQAYGKTYLPSKTLVYSKGKTKKAKAKDTSQDAHEAIRPIDVTITPEYVKRYVSPEAGSLYELIWKRFVACQLKPAQYAQRKVVIKGGIYTFSVTGSTLLFDGFLKVYQEESDSKAKDDKVSIPADIEQGSSVDLQKLTPKQHFTQPPARYTEATLVKDLEKEGIGRPSTYATILRTIQARSYTELDTKKRFVPTELGMTVTDMLKENFEQIMDTSFTAQMEQDLDKIAQGHMERDELLRSFYSDFEKSLEKFVGEGIRKQAEPTDITCPECKKDTLVIRFGKAGAFLGCASFPECTFTSAFKRDESGNIVIVEQEQPQVLDKICPKCEKNLRTVKGRFGPFTACSGYPQCKYIEPVTANFKCLSCKEGDVVKRIWKGNTFWGCSRYPKCSFSIPGDIEQTPCPSCSKPFLLKRKDKDSNPVFSCSDKECTYNKK